VDAGALSSTAAKAVFEEMFNSGESAAQIAARKGLTQVSQASDLDSFVEQALAQNHAAVVDYKAGKTQAVAFLVGQVMRLSRGRANPQVVTSLIKKKLDGTS
ncbi:MAG: Asp-tRNA(Asn)/Glu-tRNA(Gln) amidotransferase GatCAB subunit B, partial [Chloroflexi bacterium]|nr:Asp-tRNA(Asn)/Glu-tRNA(Gln) amidotransferase GatCAB subunit B [Chloroflexota bacterium]